MGAPLARETDICTRPERACGSVRAMPEHSTCRGCFVVLSAYRVDASDDGPVMGLRVDHLVESVFRQLASQLVDAVWLLDDVAVGTHPRLPETARRGDERVGHVQVGCEVAHMSGSPLSLYGFAFSALADGSRLYGIEALIYAYKRFDSVVGTGMPTLLFRGLKSPLRALDCRLAFVKPCLRWQASLVIPLMVRGSSATCYYIEGTVSLSKLRENKGERPYNGCSPCSENGHLHATGGNARVCEGYARTQHVP